MVIHWIFFDIGSTLVNEMACYRKRFEDAVAGTGISVSAFEKKVIEFARQNKKGDHEAARYFGVSLPKWPVEAENLYPETRRVLSSLKQRGFHLGVIANQSAGTEERLRSWGLRDYFEIVIASAEVGVSKPDLQIFYMALEQAGCLPQEAIMVGDRLDNDITPAKTLGMGTVWVRQGYARYSTPQTAAEEPDYTVESLADVPDLLLQ